jgi:hypothetical protein
MEHAFTTASPPPPPGGTGVPSAGSRPADAQPGVAAGSPEAQRGSAGPGETGTATAFWRDVVQDDRLFRARRAPPNEALGAHATANHAVSEGADVRLVAAAPRLRGDGSGPVAAMSLLLSGTPTPGALYLGPWVAGGRLTCEVECRLDERDRPGLERALDCGTVKACFAREARFALVRRGEVLAEAATAGLHPSAALSAALGREEAIEAMHAFGGTAPAGAPLLELDVRLRLEVGTMRRTLRLSGRWSDAWPELEARADASGLVEAASLDAALAALLARGAVRLADGAGAPVDDLEAAVAIFRRAGAFFLGSEANGAVALRRQPAASFPLDAAETMARPETDEVGFRTPLAALIALHFGGRSAAGHLHLVTLDPDGSHGPVSSPRQTRSARNDVVMLAQGNHMLFGQAVVETASLTAIKVHETVVSQAMAAHLAAEFGKHRRPPAPRSLPVFGDGEAARPGTLYPDRLSANLRWYVPDFVLAARSPTADPETAPFRLDIERRGVTGTGRPALEGTLRFRLAARTSPEAAAALEGARAAGQEVRPVALLDPGVQLEIPYLDDATNRPGTRSVLCSVAREGGDLACTATLSNDWVRVAYAALSRPGFQHHAMVSARVRFAFETYTLLPPDRAKRIPNGRIDRLPPLDFEADGARLRVGRDTLVLGHDDGPAAHAPRGGVAAAGLALRPAAAAQIVARPKPQGQFQGAYLEQIVAILAQPTYVDAMRHGEAAADILVPCAEHPHLYRELRESGWHSLGCQDAYMLGQASSRMFEEIVALATPAARVFRSMQQADVFMIAPARYRLTRTANGATAVPALALYQVLSVDPRETRLAFDLALQPDLSPAARRDLLLRLAALSRAPVLRYPTEFDLRDLGVTLNGVSGASHAAQGPFLKVTLPCDLSGAMLLKSMIETGGIAGSARFAFADGTTIDVALDIALRRVSGPWDSGEVAARPAGTAVQIRNVTERAQDVEAVLCHGPVRRLPVGRTLASGEAATIPAEEECAEAYALAVAAGSGPFTIEEVRSIVGEFRREVVFFTQADFAAEGLSGIEIDAEIEGMRDRRRAVLDPSVRESRLIFVLPLTAYLADPAVICRIQGVRPDGSRTEPSEIRTRLSQSGLVEVAPIRSTPRDADPASPL